MGSWKDKYEKMPLDNLLWGADDGMLEKLNATLNNQTYRDSPGLTPKQREQRHRNVNLFRCSREFVEGQEKMPSDLEAMAKEVLGQSYWDDDGSQRFYGFFHPYFKRWMFAEKTRDDDGEPYMRVFYTCQQDVELNDPPPSDYKDNPLLAHLAGSIGEFAMPERRDFEIVRTFDMRYADVEWVNQYFDTVDTQKEREANAHMDDFEWDFLMYHYWLMKSEEDGGRMWSTATVEHVKGEAMTPQAVREAKLDIAPPSKYKNVWKPTANGGYFVREKLSKEQHIEDTICYLKIQLDWEMKKRQARMRIPEVSDGDPAQPNEVELAITDQLDEAIFKKLELEARAEARKAMRQESTPHLNKIADELIRNYDAIDNIDAVAMRNKFASTIKEFV